MGAAAHRSNTYEGSVIPYTGEPMHDPERDGGCWADRGGTDCGAPAVINGLCVDDYVRITGERPTMAIQAADVG